MAITVFATVTGITFNRFLPALDVGVDTFAQKLAHDPLCRRSFLLCGPSWV